MSIFLEKFFHSCHTLHYIYMERTIYLPFEIQNQIFSKHFQSFGQCFRRRKHAGPKT